MGSDRFAFTVGQIRVGELRTTVARSSDAPRPCGDLIEIEKGIEALDGQRPACICVAHVEFSTMEGLKRGLEEHAEELMADVPNYTNIEPEVQVSEVVEPS